MKLSKDYEKLKADFERSSPTPEVPDKGNPEKTFKTLRSVTIEGTFPELKGRFSTPTGRGQATNVRAAGANAMRDLLKQVKGKKFTHATATVSFGTVQVSEEGQ